MEKKKIARRKLVTFEQAQDLDKLFKSMDVEFPALDAYWWVEKTDTLFTIYGEVRFEYDALSNLNKHNGDIFVDAPALNDIRDWFAKHDIVISADYDGSEKYICKVFCLDSMGHKMCVYVMDVFSEIIQFDDYYDALSAGVSKAIELLKNNETEKKAE